jgi:hypothetical protein
VRIYIEDTVFSVMVTSVSAENAASIFRALQALCNSTRMKQGINML